MSLIQTSISRKIPSTLPPTVRGIKPVPYYEDDSVILYHGDAREILPLLDPAIASLCLTDPPYGQGYVTGHRATHDPLRQAIAGDENLDLLREVAPMIDPVIKENSHLYFFASANARKAGETAEIVSGIWTVKNTLIWDKGNCGTGGDLEAGYSINFEHIVYASKGRRKLNGKRPRTILREEWTSNRDPVHSTVKPVGLLETLIKNSTDQDELIIDCFAGSGTTLRAAKNLGRRAIGIELSEEFCERTVERLRSQISIYEEKSI